MSWRTAYRSFYYLNAPEPEDIVLVPAETALLVIDIQNTYLEPSPIRPKMPAGSHFSRACGRP
jgi:hypothetical protein